MASVNKVIAIGNLGKDCEVRYTTGGDAVANFSIACSEQWKDKATGEKKESTEWVRCTAFGRTAEIAGEYLHKGSPVYIEGRLRTREYTKDDGVKRFVTEVMVDRLQLLGGKPEGATKPAQQERPAAKVATSVPPVGRQPGEDFDDSIPF